MRSQLLFPLCLSAIYAICTTGVAEEMERSISVAGQGNVTSVPDMATVQTGVVTQATSAGDALAANNTAMAKIMEVLKGHNIADKDVQTSQFHVQPEYRQDRQGRQQPEIVGYRVTNQVQVRVRKLPDLGKVLDALVEAGSNQVSGISFGIDDTTGLLNQARNRAIADARSRAELYAHAAGVRVGKVLAISEQPPRTPEPRFFARGLMEQASAVPIATGEQELQASIFMVFALADAE